MPDSFQKRQLRVEVTLGEGTFDGQHNTRVIEGLETSVNIEKPGLPDKGKASISIANMAYDDMAQLTMLAFRPLTLQKNSIRIFAGAEGGELSLAFSGEIISSWADFSGFPTVHMRMEAQTGGYAALMAQGPLAAQGEVAAEKLLQQFANEMGYTFINEGVTASVRNAVLSGSPLEKAQAVARQIGAQLIVDDNRLILMPYDGVRTGTAVLLTPETGMLGYPSFSNEGISLSCLYNPCLELGGLVRVESVVPGATGTWKINKLSHNLLANASSSGPWTSAVEASFYDE